MYKSSLIKAVFWFIMWSMFYYGVVEGIKGIYNFLALLWIITVVTGYTMLDDKAIAQAARGPTAKTWERKTHHIISLVFILVCIYFSQFFLTLLAALFKLFELTFQKEVELERCNIADRGLA